MQTTVIYIPGLGDAYDPFRAFALQIWRFWGVAAIHVPITWNDGANMESKLERIRTVVEAVPNASKVVLIGESAGATLALHAAAEDKRIHRVITLCGVARPNTPISGYLRKRSPALSQGVDSLSEAYDLDIHSVRAAVDTVVGKRYSVVQGAKEHVLWSVGHLFTIVLCLTVLSPFMANIAKK